MLTQTGTNNEFYFTDVEFAAQEAVLQLQQERDGTAPGFVCRYGTINRAVGRQFRKGYIYGIAGASGAGKSHLFGRLNSDFSSNELVVDKRLFKAETIEHLIEKCYFIEQGDYVVLFPLNDTPIKVYTANLEMPTTREYIRRASDVIKKGTQYLMSSFYDEISSSLMGYDVYVKISPEDLKLIEHLVPQFPQANQVFIEKADYLNGIVDNICNDLERLPTPVTPVIAIDHLLLLSSNGTDLDKMNEGARAAVDIAKRGFAVFLMAQFNHEYERVDRFRSVANHYPKRSDLYMGGQLFHACDVLFAMLQPNDLNCTKYGPDELPTKDLIHLSNIKGRDSKKKQLWFKNELHRGDIIELSYDKETKTLTKLKNLYEQRNDIYRAGGGSNS